MSLFNEDITESPDTITENSGTIENPGENSGIESPSWYWDENVPGQGERPKFLPDKYKSVAEVAKAYKELESKLGAAPKEYDFSKGESWIEPDYQPFVDMAEYAKSKHVPQDVMDKMLESVSLYLDEFKTDINEEKNKLGEKASERIQLLNNWAKSNLSDKSYAALATGMRTAEQIEALEEIRDKMLNNNTMVPGGNENSVSSQLTIEDYRSELNENYSKYKTDPAYRQKMQQKLEAIMGKK